MSGVVSYSLYEFRNVRGKKSSNRIELSRLVQDLLKFGVLGSLQFWGGWWMGVGDGWGVSPTHIHMHMHVW